MATVRGGSSTSSVVLQVLLLVTLLQNTYPTLLSSCYDGAYTVTLPPFNSCSGYRDCELGHYCVDGKKTACPAGSFGDRIRLNSSACSGVCPAGFFCPVATISATSNPCGHAGVYCPIGSKVPISVPEGYYSINGANTENDVKVRTSVQICPFGTYCQDGIMRKCPAGRYGIQQGLSDPLCSGECPEGFYCPLGSTDPFANPCTSQHTFYCPAGTDYPTPIGLGYYTEMSDVSKQYGGGFTSQEKCPRGTYCQGGIRYDCPAGRYGAKIQEVNASCTGICHSGYYCPPGSILASQHTCDHPGVYCPEGSAAPVNVAVGYYTVGYVGNGSLAATLVVDGNVMLGIARAHQTLCEPGYFCILDGIKRPCPPGRYGASYGLATSVCSGFCKQGYYCPEGSSNETQLECGGADVFCPPGSAAPQSVDTGYYTLGGSDAKTHYDQRKCEPGFYCVAGIKQLCLPGFYGDEFGQITATCSGPCSPGYYCPEGSISSTEIYCGEANRYCPGNNFHPLNVNVGYYSIGGNESTRSAQVIAPPGFYASRGLLYPCPAGYFGAVSGLHNAQCSGKCFLPGFYCPTASTSPGMRYCGGDDLFCPAGVPAPIRVKPGFYTTDYLEDVCPPGQWRNLTLPLAPFLDTGDDPLIKEFVKPECGLCPNGTYKIVPGDEYSLCLPCDLSNSKSAADGMTCDCLTVYLYPYVGYFNIQTGLCEKMDVSIIPTLSDIAWSANTSITRYREFVCEPGHFCTHGLRKKCPAGAYGSRYQESHPQCTGLCADGYYCMHGSTSPYSQPCGEAKYICPVGSKVPTLVPPGYYSNEDVDESLRYSMEICPVGYFCPGDGKRYQCPAGTFTDQEGTVSDQCMGPCDRGHYCLTGSSSRVQFDCGNATVFCPRGSPWPTAVTNGFYCAHSGDDTGAMFLYDRNNATCSVELPCEPGYYCVAGVKYPCPPGVFGWRYGMNSSTCGGQCSPGFYCPSYLLPQPDAPPFTVWPGKPHLRPNELICGDVNYYCPRGSKYPIRVSGGYYSTGGNYDNKTRSGQEICPPGSYCVGAVPVLCAKGRYGSVAGLAVSECEADCPAGHYCPPGTVLPIPCAEGSYSTGKVAHCTPCPGLRTTPMKCKTDNSCCLRD